MSEEPTKAKDIPARERFASTTFRTLPHAQTPEGMLEAKDAEIAALRAECARKDEALKRLMAASEEVDKACKARAASLSTRVVADLKELETHGLLEIFREQNRDLCDRLLRQLETK